MWVFTFTTEQSRPDTQIHRYAAKQILSYTDRDTFAGGGGAVEKGLTALRGNCALS